MGSFENFVRNQRTKERAKELFLDARDAVEDFRNRDYAEGFPALRSYLLRRSSRPGTITSFSLRGFDREDIRPPLSEEEYERMRVAYESLPAEDVGEDEED